jgi:hypothetical protein
MKNIQRHRRMRRNMLIMFEINRVSGEEGMHLLRNA